MQNKNCSQGIINFTLIEKINQQTIHLEEFFLYLNNQKNNDNEENSQEVSNSTNIKKVEPLNNLSGINNEFLHKKMKK